VFGEYFLESVEHSSRGTIREIAEHNGQSAIQRTT